MYGSKMYVTRLHLYYDGSTPLQLQKFRDSLDSEHSYSGLLGDHEV
jgi:hypothetical protein